MNLGRIADRLVPRRRRPARRDGAPGEIVPREDVPHDDPVAAARRRRPADPFDAARERLRSTIPPPGDDD
ncbi:MAG TPA: hypothetical protein VIL64_05830 [Solirubrobacteraceae bacterium]